MTKIIDLPFSDSSDFVSCRWLGANGIFQSGASLPNGITDRITIQDSACRLYLNTNDAATASWKRTEMDFGEIPTTLGEYWFSFDFKYDWLFSNYIVIGSVSVMIDGSSGIAYVPIGFRIREHHLVIQSSRNFDVGFLNRDLGLAAIRPDNWYKICVHINFQPDGTGYREVYINGKTIFRQYNTQTTYGSASGHYFKVGPYDGEHEENFEEATLWIRNVAVWSGPYGYQTIMGSVPMIGESMLIL